MRFSITTGCGYPETIDYGDSLPPDVQDIDDATFRALLAARGAGKVIVAGAEGQPLVQDPPPPGSMELLAYANAKQWAIATGGYTVSIAGQELTLLTDTVSQALLNGKWSRLQAPNAPATVNWQFPGVGFVHVPADDFAAAASAVADFVQATFDALEHVLTAIAAGEITTAAQIDGAAWPIAHG